MTALRARRATKVVAPHRSGILARVHRGWAAWITDTPGAPSHPLMMRLRSLTTAVINSPIVLTALPVILLALCGVSQVTHQLDIKNPPASAVAAFSVLLTIPLLFRLTHPLASYAVLVVVALVQWVSDVQVVADVALLFGVYTVAVRYPLRVAVVAAGILEFGCLIAVMRWQPSHDWAQTLVLLSGPVAAALFAGLAVRSRRAAVAAAIERGLRQEREKHQEVLLESAAERARIAREMHDVIAHGLSIMVTLSEAAIAKQPKDSAAARAAMRQVSATGREALGDVRRVLGVLRSDTDAVAHRPQPALGDLETLFESVRRAGIDVEFRSDAEISDTSLSPAVQLTLYRIVQEALTNILKHAITPQRAAVELRLRGDAIVVRVVDDGAVAAASVDVPGFGLTGIGERVATYGGRVEAGPVVGGGWSVVAVIPGVGTDNSRPPELQSHSEGG